MIKLLKYLKWWHWLILGFNLLITVAQVYLELKLPEHTNAIATIVGTTGDINQILTEAGSMLLLSLGVVAIMIIVSYLSSRLGSDLSQTLRTKVYEKVDSFSKNEKNKFQTASLITRSTNDIQQVQQIMIMLMRGFMVAPLMAGFAIYKISNLNVTNGTWNMGYNVIIGVGILVVMLAILFGLVFPKFSVMQKNVDELNQNTRENLMGVRVIRAYNAEEYQSQKFEKTNDKLTKTNLFVNKVMSFMWPGMNLIFGLLNLSLTAVGALIISGWAPGSNYVAGAGLVMEFTNYSTQVFMSFMTLTMMFIMFPRGQISAKRINEVLDTNPTIVDGNKTFRPNDREPLLSFENVCFRYEDAEEYVLKNINLTADTGETVAFIGSTGSGKSTLINLVPRFYDATEGSIKIKGLDIKDLKLSDLRGLIGYVPQQGFLFNDTIEGNMKVANPNASEEEILDALKIAQAYKFVSKYDDGINHEIEQGGKNVSGGQRQRLSIARAIVKNPDIYIFDDSFSALDYKTDKAVRKALKKKTNKALTLIVSQRIGTIMHADKIVLLDKGNVLAIGKHKDLLKQSKEYQEMAYSQLSEEELANA